MYEKREEMIKTKYQKSENILTKIYLDKEINLETAITFFEKNYQKLLTETGKNVRIDMLR